MCFWIGARCLHQTCAICLLLWIFVCTRASMNLMSDSDPERWKMKLMHLNRNTHSHTHIETKWKISAIIVNIIITIIAAATTTNNNNINSNNTHRILAMANCARQWVLSFAMSFTSPKQKTNKFYCFCRKEMNALSY